MKKAKVLKDLTDWQMLCRFLPSGWADQARQMGALRRARGVAGAEELLRILMVHLVDGCSLIETSLRTRQAGLGQLSPVAIHKRLRASEQWLRWLAFELRRGNPTALPLLGRRTLAVDATTVSESGSTGTNWRLHYAFSLADLQCTHFELTGKEGGETWRRFPVEPGDILMGDRVYATAAGIAHVLQQHGDVIVRAKYTGLPLYSESGEPLHALDLVKGLRVGKTREWPAQVRSPQGEDWGGRLIALKRGRAATRHKRQQLKRQASKRQVRVTPQALEAAAYFFLWTSLPLELIGAQAILDFYKLRWQIELAFKRMKSLLGLGHLPKKDPQSCRAWLHGKLFGALLIERIAEECNSISPWGYRLEAPPKSLARNGVHLA